jgi:prepilin-type N-terminal cleavage/methylation domain-containing protein
MKSDHFVMRRASCAVRTAQNTQRKTHSAERTTQSAFTLVEVLVSISIFAIIAAAIIAVFTKGVEVWENTRISTNFREEALLFLEGLEKELKNNINLRDSEFKTEKQSLYFTTLKEAVYNIRYEFNENNKTLIRYKSRYPKPASSAKPVLILKNVKTLNFFAGYAELKKDGEKDIIKLPEIIKINLTVSGENLQNKYELERVISMPVI